MCVSVRAHIQTPVSSHICVLSDFDLATVFLVLCEITAKWAYPLRSHLSLNILSVLEAHWRWLCHSPSPQMAEPGLS